MNHYARLQSAPGRSRRSRVFLSEGMNMRKLNVTIPANQAPAMMTALVDAIEHMRANRDACDDARARQVWEAPRDALGFLYLQIAIADARPAPARSGKRWTGDEDMLLHACWGPARRAAGGSEEALQALADAVQRSPVAVALRLAHLGIWR